MWTIVWNSIALAFVGTLLLRIAGRKSISQMTTPQLAILLSIGSILGSEVGDKGLANSILGTSIFIVFLVFMEWITLKWKVAEHLLKGKPIFVISDGVLNIKNMKSIRLSTEDLEKRLRMAGISRIDDVKSGTIEANGELGYELMPHARPITMGDFEKFMLINFPNLSVQNIQSQETDTLFTESKNNIH
ncbi:DUF421 domain-containing protein [Paenibacillus sp. CGMCC 1.16610]|uniref:DUF421 domain-containing protein n=1 Tax=Paenibacillus anseongense TaxID=2682845 RepID=A0ABW9UH14_9BACL|nr:MULTISPECIES: YetF domain-containing protein [Paenibacillus]MBA2939807.1 DUF421 domain-containing protein [Paenibacillus sp. CGMCC 1.16610]MVQ39467.1 DUF421 domain-containing protein [Paenibacillus anseongense]